MSSKEQIQDVVPGGPTKKEAREPNRPRPVQGVALNRSKETRTHLVKKTANVLAASLALLNLTSLL